MNDSKSIYLLLKKSNRMSLAFTT